MLDPQDLAKVASTFAVAEEQVRRDHLIGHALAALESLNLPKLVFFGGTALTWTLLPTGRLSEDIDLYVADRPAAAAIIDRELPRKLRREFPGIMWDPGLSAVRSVDPARLVSRDGLVIRIQLLDVERQGWSFLPAEQRSLVERYRDLSGVTLRVPTAASFGAMKTLAWVDRRTPRDLFDLAGLSTVGALGAAAADLFHQATGRRVAPYDFTGSAPRDWVAALQHQTGALPSALSCLDVVRASFGAALGWSVPR
jgi:predicted nucleotidyltransferase component of viral defense system